MDTEHTQQQKQHAHGMIERLAPEKLSALKSCSILSTAPWPLPRSMTNP